jgi:hypothetical protein
MLRFHGGEMTASWKFFIPAVLMGGYLLVSFGAPLGPVLLGCAAAAAANALLGWRGRSRQAPRSD